ncbi:4Fe-4S binding protein, partial [Candidatus Izimaplasma bacterium]|nr:4Fe-4S binding protein [Candidatus Izimaplasma bacterium]
AEGLYGKPTIINNVETLGNIASIIRNGATWFKSFGTEKSPGTKVFALAGKVKMTGLIEVPMGITLGEIINEIGNGVGKKRTFKAVLTGGPSGGCLSKDHLNEIVDFDNLVRLGSMMGSGGMIVLDDHDCMVDIAKFYMGFCVEESCGKCTPCREGTIQMYKLLEKISDGEGTMDDLEKLKNLSINVKEASLCGLGTTAPNPVLSTLENFYDEYLEHINEKKCRSSICKGLINEYFITDKCTGCTLCARRCPEQCISGEQKGLHVIDSSLCIKCGECFASCNFDAIITR